MKKIGADLILTVIAAPFVIWFMGFVISSYKTEAEVENTKSDI